MCCVCGPAGVSAHVLLCVWASGSECTCAVVCGPVGVSAHVLLCVWASGSECTCAVVCVGQWE